MRAKKFSDRIGRAGKVTIGKKIPTKSGKERPSSVDHFIFKCEHHESLKLIEETFGKNPKKIQIAFYSDEHEHSCDYRLELRDKSGKLVSSGDGQVFYTSSKGILNQKFDVTAEKLHENLLKHADAFGIQHEDEDERKSLAYQEGLRRKYSVGKFEAKWEEVVTLKFLLPASKTLGYWEFKTKGKGSSIPNIVSSFDKVIEFNGTAVGVPFFLSVDIHQSNNVASAGSKYPVVSLTAFAANAIDTQLSKNGGNKLLG